MLATLTMPQITSQRGSPPCKHNRRIVLFGKDLANRLFMEWRGRQQKPPHKTTTDFAASMAAEHARHRLRLATSRHPTLNTPS